VKVSLSLPHFVFNFTVGFPFLPLAYAIFLSAFGLAFQVAFALLAFICLFLPILPFYLNNMLF
jgi:hypothetical protein